MARSLIFFLFSLSRFAPGAALVGLAGPGDGASNDRMSYLPNFLVLALAAAELSNDAAARSSCDCVATRRGALICRGGGVGVRPGTRASAVQCRRAGGTGV